MTDYIEKKKEVTCLRLQGQDFLNGQVCSNHSIEEIKQEGTFLSFAEQDYYKTEKFKKAN